MHSGPNPVYHRDIREPNILKRRDQDEWFLIDWSDASTTPTKASRTMLKESHSPRVFEDDHGGEVDIWGVARYLCDSVSRFKLQEKKKIVTMAERWMNDHTITADTALDELTVCSKILIDGHLHIPSTEISTLIHGRLGQVLQAIAGHRVRTSHYFL
jgi:hypothetical protein